MLQLPPIDHALQLLYRMRVVKFQPLCSYPSYRWTAQRVGCDLWGYGSTPIEAMLDAISK